MERCFYIETYGCSANKNDSEIIAGILSKSGMVKVDNPKLAELIIINTCIVKKPTENKILHRIKELEGKFPEKKFLIAGCMPEAYPELVKKNFPGMSTISTNKIKEISKAVRNVFGGKKVEFVGKLKDEKIGLPRIKENEVIHIVQICSGCLGNCSYCATKLAKGNLVSFSPERIVAEIKKAKQQGAKEFWLTGQDISCYGFDIGTTLPELLEKILEEVKGEYFVRLGMLNPQHFKKIIEPLVEVCKDERVFKFFHIPVQSGSEKILKEMDRDYKIKDFESCVKKIRENFPDATIWTDIIVGYPGEEEKDFEETLNLIKRLKFDWVNVSKFYLMRKTRARQPKTKVAKERSKKVGELVEEISAEKNKRWDNWIGKILVDDLGVGRNFAYKAIHIKKKRGLIDKFLEVKTKTKGLKINGKIVKD